MANIFKKSSFKSILKSPNGRAIGDKLVVDNLVEKYFPDKPETIVPLAISLALITESAEETILLAANVGGDADSVASMELLAHFIPIR